MTNDRSVEALLGDAWMTSWAPSCALLGSSALPDELQQGQTLRQTIRVDAALQGPASPAWTGGALPGRIRFAAGLVPHGLSGRIPTIASNAVRLVLAR